MFPRDFFSGFFPWKIHQKNPISLHWSYLCYPKYHGPFFVFHDFLLCFNFVTNNSYNFPIIYHIPYVPPKTVSICSRNFAKIAKIFRIIAMFFHIISVMWMVANSCTTKRMVETQQTPWDVYHLSTGAGSLNHPQYPLVNCHVTMENHHFQWVNQL